MVTYMYHKNKTKFAKSEFLSCVPFLFLAQLQHGPLNLQLLGAIDNVDMFCHTHHLHFHHRFFAVIPNRIVTRDVLRAAMEGVE